MEERRISGVSNSRVNPSHSSHHQHTPRNLAPRNERSSWLRHRLFPASSSVLLILLTISCCISLSSASHFYIDEQMIESIEADDGSEDLGSALARLAKSGTILVDQGPPPNPKAWTLQTEHDGLQRRGADSSSSSKDHTSSSKVSSTSSMITTASTSSSATKTSSSIVAATTAAASPLPSPFDQGFSGNITDSCQSFMDGMLGNATFKSCLPFSLLLQVLPPFHHPLPQLINGL